MAPNTFGLLILQIGAFPKIMRKISVKKSLLKMKDKKKPVEKGKIDLLVESERRKICNNLLTVTYV